MPFALVALVLVPVIAVSLRLVELAGGPHVMPANPRITASPVPVVVHLVSAVAYVIRRPRSRRTSRMAAEVGFS